MSVGTSRDSTTLPTHHAPPTATTPHTTHQTQYITEHSREPRHKTAHSSYGISQAIVRHITGNRLPVICRLHHMPYRLHQTPHTAPITRVSRHKRGDSTHLTTHLTTHLPRHLLIHLHTTPTHNHPTPTHNHPTPAHNQQQHKRGEAHTCTE